MESDRALHQPQDLLCCGTPDVECGCSAALSLGRSLLKGKDVLAAQMCWIRDGIDDSLQPDLGGIKTEELSHPLCSTWLFPGMAEEFGVVLAPSGTASTPVAKGTAGEIQGEQGWKAADPACSLLMGLLHKEPSCSCSERVSLCLSHSSCLSQPGK